MILIDSASAHGLSDRQAGAPSGSCSATRDVIEAYFAAFNRKDVEALLDTLSEDVIHEINEGPTEKGKEAFRRYKAHMDRCYDEVISELVIMTFGTRGAAEFTCTGRYLAQDGTLPPARGQKYQLSAAAFFEVKEEKIVRITGLYNLRKFVALVTGESLEEAQALGLHPH